MIKGIVGMVLCWILVASAFFVTTPTGESSQSEDRDIGTEVEPTQVRVGFTKNCGQLDDDSVRYYVQGRGIWLLDDCVVMDIRESTDGSDLMDLRTPDEEFTGLLDSDIQCKGVVLKLVFIGASDVSPDGEGLMDQKSDFYYGADPNGWFTHVPNFETIVYQNVYDGIDLAFSYTDEGLKYEFTVHAGADPDEIGLRYEGAEGLSIDSHGDLSIQAGATTLTDSGLFIYQQGKNGPSRVKGEFRVLDATSYGFEISGKYDMNEDLVIDPLLYSTFVGFEENEAGTDIAVDEHGDAYVTGTTSSSGFPTTTGAYDTTINGMFDVFVFKLRPAGGGTTDMIYSTFIGGSENDVGYGIHVEAGGYAYVTGGTQSYGFPTTVGAYDTSYNGGWDVFVLKLNPAGAGLMYSTFIGGELHEIGMDVEPDSYRFAYVTGLTASPGFPATTGAPAGGYDVFSLKLNPAGTGLAYSIRVGGKLFDAGTAIALDSGYKAYVTGYTISVDFPTTAVAYSPGPNGGIDAFVFRVNTAGNSLEFSTYIGGTTGDMGQGIDLDDNGNAYVTGTTNSPAFPTTSGAYSTALAGGVDVFALVLDVTGSFLHYSTYVGGPKADWGFDIAIDEDKVMYVTGFTNSNPFPTTLGAYDTTYNGNWDVFVFKLEPAGGGSADLIYSTYVGANRGEGGYGIAVDELKDAYVTGLTSSELFPTTVGAYDETYNGNFDVFVFKLTLEPLSGAAKMKIDATKMLIAVKPRDKQEARMLVTAIEQIRMSLDGGRWVDGTHLEAKGGAKVFDHERKAVHELERLMGTTQDKELLAACQGAMDKLVEADRLLAMTAFGDACRVDVDLDVGVPYDGELEKCMEELKKAQQEEEEGNEGAAIHHYGKAWQCAQRAMMHDDDDGNWFVDDI